MNQVPWYALSPSPTTLAFFAILAIYGASKLEHHTRMDWFSNFSHAAFILGMVVLPMDALWCMGSGLKWQYLYPTDYSWFYSLLRDVVLILFSWHEIGNFFNTKGSVIKRNLLWTPLVFIPFFAVQFYLAPNPNWTDWTYGLRYGYPLNDIILSCLIQIPAKSIIAIIYVKLWKKKTNAKQNSI